MLRIPIEGNADRQMNQINLTDRLIFPWSIFEADRRKPRPGTSPFTITLSREAGTGVTEIAHDVGSRLGWPVYDHELLERIALDTGLRASLLESVDEHRGAWLKEAFANLFNVPHISDLAYVHYVVKTVLALGAHGKCLIVGRGSTFILPAPSTLRVRLVAPFEHRVGKLSQRLGIDRAKASETVLALDYERAGFVQDYFQHDPHNPHYYDLVLNTARFSVAECADLIVDGLHRLQAREFPRSSEPIAV
jgi:cytidylate kinase